MAYNYWNGERKKQYDDYYTNKWDEDYDRSARDHSNALSECNRKYTSDTCEWSECFEQANKAQLERSNKDFKEYLDSIRENPWKTWLDIPCGATPRKSPKTPKGGGR